MPAVAVFEFFPDVAGTRVISSDLLAHSGLSEIAGDKLVMRTCIGSRNTVCYLSEGCGTGQH